MAGVEEVESKRRFRSIERCGIPPHPQELAVMRYPPRSFFAGTELDVHMVGTTKVDDEDLLRGSGGWARGMLMANIEAEAQFGKLSGLIKHVSPNL